MQHGSGQHGLDYEECGAIQRPRPASASAAEPDAVELETGGPDAATSVEQASRGEFPKWQAWLLRGVGRPPDAAPGTSDLLATVNRPPAPGPPEKKFSEQTFRENIVALVICCCLVIFVPVSMFYHTNLNAELYQQGHITRGEYLSKIWIGNTASVCIILIAALGITCVIWPKLGDELYERWRKLLQRFR